MGNTLNPWIKWLATSLVPAFTTGSTLLAAGIQPNTFGFWWPVAGAFVGGLAAKTMTVMGDNAIQKKSGG